MTETQIKKLQEQYGYDKWQQLITSGSVWSLEGTAGRTAMQYLEAGVCFLPKVQKVDYYGNTIPSRDSLAKGSKGTIENAGEFWSKVESGEVDLENDEYFAWM